MLLRRRLQRLFLEAIQLAALFLVVFWLTLGVGHGEQAKLARCPRQAPERGESWALPSPTSVMQAR